MDAVELAAPACAWGAHEDLDIGVFGESIDPRFEKGKIDSWDICGS